MATQQQIDATVQQVRSIWASNNSVENKISSTINVIKNVESTQAFASVITRLSVPPEYTNAVINGVTATSSSTRNASPGQNLLRVYTSFGGDDVVQNLTRRVTTGMWTGNTGSLYSFYTSSTQSGSTGDWYYNVYNANPDVTSSAEVQFAVAYGHLRGHGYPSINTLNTSKEATKAVYAQYKNVLLDPEDNKFTFAGNISRDEIFVINIQRARLKQKMDPGNWELVLSGSGDMTSLRTGLTGSGIRLIDDSADNFDKKVSGVGRVFNVVQGNLTVGAAATVFTAAANEPSGGLGLFYPDRGIIVLNPKALSYYIGLSGSSAGSTGSATVDNNHGKLFKTIVSGGYFQARNEEIVTSTHYFVRVKNKEYNFSNNPTFYTSSDGSLRIASFVGDPKTYITTVGLYDESNQLLAVGKLSQPVLKSYDREALIKVKLDY